MLQPVQKDHELCCPSCGCVLAQIDEEIHEKAEKYTIPTSLNILILGEALSSKGKIRNPQEVYENNVRQNLINLTQKFGLPERFVIETLNELKRKKRGFRSEYAYINELLKILSKDENYIHIHKMRAIKARYESILNH